MSGGRYASFNEDDIRRLGRKIKEKEKVEAEEKEAVDETIAILHDNLKMAL